MEASFSTIILSAGVGGLAGSLFPSIRNAFSYLILEAPAFITKTESETKFEAEQWQSRTELLFDIHERTVATRDAAVRAKALFDRLSSLNAEDDRSPFVPETAAILLDMKNSVAYLEVFDAESLHSAHAARLIQRTIDFALFNIALIESVFEAEHGRLGSWVDLEGPFTIQARVGVKWGSLLSSIQGSLSRFDRSQKDQRRRKEFRLQEMIESVRQARSKKVWYAVFLTASFLLLLAALYLVAKSIR